MVQQHPECTGCQGKPGGNKIQQEKDEAQRGLCGVEYEAGARVSVVATLKGTEQLLVPDCRKGKPVENCFAGFAFIEKIGKINFNALKNNAMEEKNTTVKIGSGSHFQVLRNRKTTMFSRHCCSL